MGTSYTVPEQLRTFSSTARTKCKLFDLLFDGKTRSLSIQTKDIFTENIEVNFKELYNFLCYINDSIDCDATYINLVNLENQKTAEVCLGAPDFKVPDNFAIIFETICSTYNKLCDLNLENNVFSTKYIWSNIGRFNLFSIVGKEYIPHYVMEFQSHCDYKPEVDVVIFNSVIESTKTNILTFVAFFGSVERVQDKIFRGSFNKSEWLGDFLFNDSDNREELIELKSQYFKGLLIDRGLKAFY
jgi:hypothetical protein